jgi:MFS family permease
MSPLAGRLSQLFSPRSCILVAAFLFSVGGLVTSQASTLAVFLIGRAISGAGGAGILILSIILVLELTDKKRRGLFIGLVNAGYTSGVALGALISGALAPITGWRALFAIQLPLGILAGTGVYFSIPSDFVSGPEGSNVRTLGKKLKRIDYLGAVTLVSQDFNPQPR